jgi:predicted restriction endonuclease
VHHLRARADGGATDVDNLVLLCRRHHSMWHRKQISLSDLRVPWMRLPQPRAPSLS